jgi:hypothetical protein
MVELERRMKELAEREAAVAAFEAKQEAERKATEAKIVEAARQAEERLQAEFAAAAAEAARIDNLAKQIGEELTQNREMTNLPPACFVSNQGAIAPGGPPAADQTPGNTQAPAEPAAAPAAFQPDIPGIPVPPTDEEAAETAPNLITLGEVCRRIEHKVTEAELSRIGYPPSAKRGNAVYYKERNLVLICRALANYFTVKANALEWEQS